MKIDFVTYFPLLTGTLKSRRNSSNTASGVEVKSGGLFYNSSIPVCFERWTSCVEVLKVGC